jgi:hypothetical protein
MLRWIHVLTAVAILWPTAARAQKTKPQTPKRTVKETVRTTPAGGFTLGDKRFGFRLEFGYPMFSFQAGYGIGKRFELFVGYRGFYTATHSPYGGVKVAMFASPKRSVGLSFIALGGWTYARRPKTGSNNRKDAYYESLVGGSGGFGEAWLSMTARKKRHGGLISVGVRFSQVLKCDNCQNHLLGRDSGVMATAFAEAGYEYRFMKHMSYYVTAGVDFFTNSKWVPALPRFRTGVCVDF